MPQIRPLTTGVTEDAAVARMKAGDLLNPETQEAPPEQENSPAERDESGRFVAKEPDPIEATEPDDVEEPVAEPTEEAEDDAEEVEALEPIDPPVSWSDAEKETWAALSPEAQATIVERESERDSHLTKRSQEIAEQRQQMTQAYEAIEGERQQLHQTMMPMIQQLGQMVQTDEASIESLLDPNSPAYDPESYLAAKHRIDEQKAMLVQAQSQAAELERQQNEQRHQLYVREVAEHERLLVDAIPEWGRDPETGKREIQEIREFVKSQGVPGEMADQFYSAPMLLIARKAMIADRAAATRKSAEGKKTRPKPKLAKPGAKKGDEVKGREKVVAARRDLRNARGTRSEADAFINVMKTGKLLRPNRR